tara:strand:- start:2396 stop:2764 length:369 start_codon:yes stop_codon:yes gene_type:complete
MSQRTQRFSEIEPDNAFYKEMEDLSFRLGEAEKNLVIYTDGLSALEKKLMKEADDSFYELHKKRLPETLQRREAKRDPRYTKMIRAKASASRDKVTYRIQLDIMKMKFEEWRTRSADRRNSN